MEEEGVGVGRGEEGGEEALSWRSAGQGGAASPPSSADPPFPLVCQPLLLEVAE